MKAMLECRLQLDDTHEHDRVLKCVMCAVPEAIGSPVHTHVVGVHMEPTGYNGRLNVVIDVECEAGHAFEVIFHQHRGQTFLGVDNLDLAK